jgi:hypothetical protein
MKEFLVLLGFAFLSEAIGRFLWKKIKHRKKSMKGLPTDAFKGGKPGAK